MTKGYIYCFSNNAMPNVFKVGVTKRNPYVRLEEANKSYTWKPPLPYKLVFAKRVNNPFEKERLIHFILEKQAERINPNQEFFKTDIGNIKKVFDTFDGEYYDTPKELISFINWLDNNTVINETGFITVNELTKSTGLSESIIKQIIDKLGKYAENKYTGYELLYFTHKMLM